jgi:hypothetical protein
MKNILLTGLVTYIIFFGTVVEGWALLLETTVTATITAVEGHSPLHIGDEVTFRWTYDVSSSEMNSYCDQGEGICNTFDKTQYNGLNFLSDATITFSPHFNQILTKSLSLDNHKHSHKTVVYGGLIGNVGVLRFIHRCGDCYLSIIYYGEKKNIYMAVFQENDEGVHGIGYEFRDLKLTTIPAKRIPDPKLSSKLLSSTGILKFAGPP